MIEPLTEASVDRIKIAMSKLSIKPPEWAKRIPEEKWLPAMFRKVPKQS